ncbi:MAG: GIY-YIG nuclease family protein [Bacteroidales bacterium]|nr:GIY-YIG nuclease family protein [Bacteroidales bacterium]
MYYTYILYSPSLKKFYTGQTEDLERRFEEHNRGKTLFMKSGIPWELVYSKSFENRTEALRLERKIKKRGAKRFLEDKGIEVG